MNNQMQGLLDGFQDQVRSNLDNIKSRNRSPVLYSSGGNPFVFKNEQEQEV